MTSFEDHLRINKYIIMKMVWEYLPLWKLGHRRRQCRIQYIWGGGAISAPCLQTKPKYGKPFPNNI